MQPQSRQTEFRQIGGCIQCIQYLGTTFPEIGSNTPRFSRCKQLLQPFMGERLNHLANPCTRRSQIFLRTTSYMRQVRDYLELRIAITSGQRISPARNMSERRPDVK